MLVGMDRGARAADAGGCGVVTDERGSGAALGTRGVGRGAGRGAAGVGRGAAVVGWTVAGGGRVATDGDTGVTASRPGVDPAGA